MPDIPAIVPPLKRNRQFLILFLLQAFGFFARSIYFVTLPLFVLERTGSEFSLGLSLLVSFVPFVIAGPPLGLLIDRYSRRDLLLIAISLHTLSLLFLPFIYREYLIYILAFTASIFVVAIANCATALLPGLVDGTQLAKANSAYNALRFATFVLGTFVSFFLVRSIGKDRVFFVCSALMFVSGAVAILLKRDTLPQKHLAGKDLEASRGGAGIREAVRFIFSSRALRGLTLMHFILIPIFAASEVYMAIFSERVLNQVDYYTLLNASFGCGLILGSLLSYRMLKRIRPLSIVFYSFLVFSACIILFAYSAYLAFSLVTCFLIGITDGTGFTTYEYLRQHMVPSRLRGRVFTIMDAVVLLPMPVGYLLVGYLAGKMSTVTLGLWIGVVGIFLALLCYPFTRSSR